MVHDHIPYLWLFNRRIDALLFKMGFQRQPRSTKNHSSGRGIELRGTQRSSVKATCTSASKIDLQRTSTCTGIP